MLLVLLLPPPGFFPVRTPAVEAISEGVYNYYWRKPVEGVGSTQY